MFLLRCTYSDAVLRRSLDLSKSRSACTFAHAYGCVGQEFKTLGEDSSVFKKIGVVLVKQDPDDAKNNISRRLEMIERQLKDVDNSLKANAMKEEAARQKILVSIGSLLSTARPHARRGVCLTIFFIFVLYFCAAALFCWVHTTIQTQKKQTELKQKLEKEQQAAGGGGAAQ